jgi:hypothetical protein
MGWNEAEGWKVIERSPLMRSGSGSIFIESLKLLSGMPWSVLLWIFVICSPYFSAGDQFR